MFSFLYPPLKPCYKNAPGNRGVFVSCETQKPHKNRVKTGQKTCENLIFYALFLCKNANMSEYILKLYSLGFSPHEAYRIYWDFIKNFGREKLDEFISDIKREKKCG